MEEKAEKNASSVHWVLVAVVHQKETKSNTFGL